MFSNFVEQRSSHTQAWLSVESVSPSNDTNNFAFALGGVFLRGLATNPSRTFAF